MRLRWALQGPGPVTLAYRSSLQLRHQHTAQEGRPSRTTKLGKAGRNGFGLKSDVSAHATPYATGSTTINRGSSTDKSRRAETRKPRSRHGQERQGEPAGPATGTKDKKDAGGKKNSDEAAGDAVGAMSPRQEESREKLRRKKGPVEPIVFDFTDAKAYRQSEDERAGTDRAQRRRKQDMKPKDFTNMRSTLSDGRAADQSGSVVGVDESLRKHRTAPIPQNPSRRDNPAAPGQDASHDLVATPVQLSAFTALGETVPYTRYSRSTLDRLDLSDRHRELLRVRHHDQAIPSNDYMPIFATAPPGYRFFSQHLDQFREAVRSEDLRQMVQSYNHLCDWHSIDQFNAADWEHASQLVALSIRSQYAANAVGDMLRNHPAMYGGLADVALESAVRDHWEGLYRLMLALVRLGEPKRVGQLYERYRQKLLQHQGRTAEDLHSWDRATRMAARVDADGVKPISTVHLAALVMLDNVTGTTLASMFGSRTDWRWFGRETVEEVISVLRTVRRSDTASLVRDFQTAMSHFLLAILCHHPNALIERIREMCSSNSWSLFESLWKQVLAESVGPKRLIRPLDLAHVGKGEVETDVVITRGVWETFMDGFAHFGRPQDLWYIINDVLSSRQLVITPAMLGRASLAFARIAMTPRLSEETRRLANEYTALAHSRAIAMGYDRVDAYMGPRFEVDYVMGRNDALDTAYERLRLQGVNIGPVTRSCLAHVFASRDPARALQVLRWTLGDPKIAEPTDPYPFSRFVVSVFKARPTFPYQRIVEALLERPTGCEIYPATRALLATMMAAQNRSIKPDQYVKALIDCAGETARQRTRVITVVVTRGQLSHSTTAVEAHAALELLRDFITHRSHLQIQSRVERIWGVYLRAVIRSRALTAKQRSESVRQAVQLLVDKYGSVRSVTLLHIIEWTLSRRHVRTRVRQIEHDGASIGLGVAPNVAVASDEDTAEAIYWWKRLRGMDMEQQRDDHDPARDEVYVTGYWWERVMFILKNAGRVQEAANLVADAWDGNPEADESQRLAQYRVPPTVDWFWRSALNAGLLAKVGLGEQDLARAKRVWAGDERAWDVSPEEPPQLDGRKEEGEEESLDELEERLEDEEAEEAEQI